MPDRHFPVRPNLEQLRHQAKDLLRGMHAGETAAIIEFERNHPRPPAARAAKLADAQLALAQSYGLPSWRRLVLACRMTNAIWRNDVAEVRELVTKYPELRDEDARGVKGNWGPPMSYAANLGRDEIIAMLRGLGADRKSTRLNSSHVEISYAVFCLKKKKRTRRGRDLPPDPQGPRGQLRLGLHQRQPRAQLPAARQRGRRRARALDPALLPLPVPHR